MVEVGVVATIDIEGDEDGNKEGIVSGVVLDKLDRVLERVVVEEDKGETRILGGRGKG